MALSKKGIIIFGPPGSGKGTQAELIAKKYGHIHFDTGRYISRMLKDPHIKKTKELIREKTLMESGKLCTPSWVLKITREAVERISKSGSSVVFSGSPRTIFEALGDAKHVGLGNTLKKAFGAKNVTIIKINVRPDATMKRNSIRVSCSVCKLQLMGKLAQKISTCPFCSASLERRKDDDPKVIPARIKEFEERTLPVLEALKRFKFNMIEVDGEKLPYEVFAEIQKKLK